METRARWVTSLAEVRSLGERYDRMVLASGARGIFYRTGWLERSCPYYLSTLGGTLAFLVAERGQDLVALAPLQLRTKDWVHAKQKVLHFLGGTNDELDDWVPGFLFADRDRRAQAASVEAFVDALFEASEAWDLLDLRMLPGDCPSRAVLHAALPGMVETRESLRAPRVRLPGGWAEYLATRSRRLLRMLERGARRADGHVAYAVSTALTPADRAEVERIHLARQARVRATGRVRTSPFEAPATATVFWRLAHFAETAGHLRVYWLRVDAKPAAFAFAMSHAQTTFSFFNAIDPAAEELHPGSLLLAHLIEREATDHGVEVVDLMAGPNLTKDLFATELQGYVSAVAPNPRRALARARYAWVEAAKGLRARLGAGSPGVPPGATGMT